MTYLGGIRPRQRPPAKLVNGIGKEDHGHRRNTRRSDLLLRLGGGVVDNGDDDETHRHEQSRNPQRGFTSPHLREEEDIDTHSDELLGTEKARDEQVSAGIVAD